MQSGGLNQAGGRRMLRLGGRRKRGAVCEDRGVGMRAYWSNFLIRRHALCPPKPKLLDRAILISAWRGVRGT